MWRWDQGRMDYFQFDELRKIAKFATHNDLYQALRSPMQAATGLPYSPDQVGYERPWRNYGRTFILTMIAVPDGKGGARLTEVGKLLADDGKITADEYFHFFAQATTDPSPAFSGWSSLAPVRYPLLFVLRYLLARASQSEFTTEIAEIVRAYGSSGFVGDEDQTDFLGIIAPTGSVSKVPRQASESVKVLAQVSYLAATKTHITVSLHPDDAEKLFYDLAPIGGTRLADKANEILRIAALFPSATADLGLEYTSSVVSDLEEAGFSEGARVKRTHLTIERNAKIRSAFFAANPGANCDFCGIDTGKTYPWVPKILDIHHLLPLCSGARTSMDGTLLTDLVPNCPTCHRAVHRYYDKWLRDKGQNDFADAEEARKVYSEARAEYRKAAKC